MKIIILHFLFYIVVFCSSSGVSAASTSTAQYPDDNLHVRYSRSVEHHSSGKSEIYAAFQRYIEEANKSEDKASYVNTIRSVLNGEIEKLEREAGTLHVSAIMLQPALNKLRWDRNELKDTSEPNADRLAQLATGIEKFETLEGYFQKKVRRMKLRGQILKDLSTPVISSPEVLGKVSDAPAAGGAGASSGSASEGTTTLEGITQATKDAQFLRNIESFLETQKRMKKGKYARIQDNDPHDIQKYIQEKMGKLSLDIIFLKENAAFIKLPTEGMEEYFKTKQYKTNAFEQVQAVYAEKLPGLMDNLARSAGVVDWLTVKLVRQTLESHSSNLSKGIVDTLDPLEAAENVYEHDGVSLPVHALEAVYRKWEGRFGSLFELPVMGLEHE